MMVTIIILIIFGCVLLVTVPELFMFVAFFGTIIGMVFMLSGEGKLDEVIVELEEYVELKEAELAAKQAADPNSPAPPVDETLHKRMDILLEVTAMCSNSREIEFTHNGQLYNIGCGTPYIRDVD